MGGVASAYRVCCGSRPTYGLAGGGQQLTGYGDPQVSHELGYSQAIGTVEGPLGGPPPSPTGRKRALLVGCNYPGSQAELRGCINDVLRMSSLLRSRYDFSPDEMRTLTDDGGPAQGYSTRDNIISGMRWLVEEAQPGDALFFHYSGHGGQQLDPNYAEEDGYDETICPTDFDTRGMIVDDEIFDLICAPLPSGCKLTAFMDCCHSGTGMDLPFLWDNHQWIEEDNPCHSAGDVLLVSGCLDEQTSADATGNRGEAAGALTTALCDTIEESTNPISVAMLLQQTHAKLLNRGFDQTPSLTSSQRFDTMQRAFSFTEGFESNSNPLLGRQFRKTKHPKMDFGGMAWLCVAVPIGVEAGLYVADTFFQGPRGQDPYEAGFRDAGFGMSDDDGFETAQPSPLLSLGQSFSVLDGVSDEECWIED